MSDFNNDVELSLKEKKKNEEIHNVDNTEVMSTKEAIMTIVYSFAMYVALGTVPTIFLVCFLDIGFWLSQLITLLVIIFIILVFGLYKPASDEQKLKRKTNL